jgi:DnaJ-class molecular chaperone
MIGPKPKKVVVCGLCEGLGQVKRIIDPFPYSYPRWEWITCPECDGDYIIEKDNSDEPKHPKGV